MEGFDFNQYYDAIHKPYFALERIIHENIPFKIRVPYLEKSNHANSIPFMNLEAPLIFISIYLVICSLGKYRTTRFDHQLFKIFVNFYNAGLVILSAFMGLTVLIESSRLGYTWFNNNPDESVNGLPLAKALSVFYLSKFPELMDTVIMAIKGNTRQISFLHVYHHTSIILVCFSLIYSAPGSDTYFSAFLNSCIHTLMYSYYLLTSLQIGLFFTRRIKKFMTLLQMVFFDN